VQGLPQKVLDEEVEGTDIAVVGEAINYLLKRVSISIACSTN
jgi:hypothetical protein